tara:strand:- start:116 stop:493 length:378 start_codon:yes stop_codon:yes gene_type:complete
MDIAGLKTDLQQLLDDSKELVKIKKELAKTRRALSLAELEVVKLEEKISRIRGRNKNTLDGIDEENLFRTHAKMRFTSHINGVRALHVKARGIGKMFTRRPEVEKKETLLGEAMTYLRDSVWKEQ